MECNKLSFFVLICQQQWVSNHNITYNKREATEKNQLFISFTAYCFLNIITKKKRLYCSFLCVWPFWNENDIEGVVNLYGNHKSFPLFARNFFKIEYPRQKQAPQGRMTTLQQKKSCWGLLCSNKFNFLY